MTPAHAIEKLSAADWTEKAIGDAVGINQSSVNKIRHGRMRPSYEAGKALVDLAESLDRPTAKPKAA